MALEVRLVCCGARPEPLVEAYVRARVKDLAAEFPEIEACRMALERSPTTGWQLNMALVTSRGTVFVREAPKTPRMDDCATAVDRCLRSARRAVAAQVSENSQAA